MSKSILSIVISIPVVLWVLGQNAFAEEAVLELTVTGTILAPPKWVDSQGQNLDSALFDFSLIAQTNPFQDVDSNPLKFKLTNIESFPASIEFQKPQNCRIGSTQIKNEHIELVQNASLLASRGMLSLSAETISEYVLRFSAVGGYADKTGMVSCEQSGAMVYVY